MKIGVDIRCLLEPRYSGISEYTYQLLQHLVPVDSANRYIFFYNQAKRSVIPTFTEPNIDVRGFSYSNARFNLEMRFLRKYEIDQMIGGVDLFLMPNFLFANFSKSCKYILIVHDLSFELYPNFFTLKSRLWHRLINPRQMCLRAEKIVAVSQNTKQDLMRVYNIPENKIEVIYNGIDDALFISTPERDHAILEQYQLQPGYILYLGNLEPRKNIISLLKAFERLKLPSARLVIAGSAAWKYHELYDFWEKSPVKNRIKFLGYVDKNHKPALYRNAGVFVYPSIYEGFGLPPLEAMACGAPVIASANSSLVETVAHAGLLVDPYNINELARVIQFVLTDTALATSLREKGLQRSRQFTWGQTTKKFLSLFTKN